MDKEREKRKRQIEFGLGMNALDGVPPDEYALELGQEYIDGKKGIDEVIKLLVEKYKES